MCVSVDDSGPIIVAIGHSRCSGASCGGRLAGRPPAMAPALTQAPTPHQRCCPSANLQTLLHPVKTTKTSSKTTSDTDSDQVTAWSPTQCCGGGGAVNGNANAVNGNGHHSANGSIKNSSGNNRRSRNGREIARSDELSKSRGPGGPGQGAGSQTLDPPPVAKSLSPGADAAVAPGFLQSNGNGNGTAVSPPVGDTLADDSTRTMGLEPTAPGDRMDLNSTPPVKTDWTSTNTTTGSECPSSPTDAGDMEQVDSCVDDVIFDVIKSMEVDSDGQQCLGFTADATQLLREAAAAVMNDDDVSVSLPGHALNGLISHQATATTASSALPQMDKEAQVERKLAEARAKQQSIETRCQTLLRRAGRLQSRHVSRHVADQVAHFVDYARETLSLGSHLGRHTGSSGSNLYGWAEDGRLPTREEVRNIPTATLVNLVSRLQAPPVSYMSNRRYFGLPNKSTSLPQHHQQHSTNGSRQLSSQVAETLEEVAGLWEAQLRYLQRCDDPDATESSSGGESEDEGLPIAEQHPSAALEGAEGALPSVKPVSTYQRAAWRWARDRAAVAARWSWLQAQVSDLEYRIRQHTDVYRQLRAAKPPVNFAAPPNGFTTSPSKEAPAKDDETTATADNQANVSSSSRTRPMVRTNGGFRHRRLIKTSQLHVGSGRRPTRGSQSSSIRCCCVMSRIYHPCVLCNGKNNYLLPVDPDGMTLGERIGLTDRGFHPVLSLPHETPLGAHVESLLKSGDWRPPPPPSSAAPPNSSSAAAAAAASKAMRRSNGKPGEGEDGGAKRRAIANNKRKKLSVSVEQGGSLAGPEDGKGLERRKSLMKRRKRATLSTDAMDEDSGSFPPSPYTDGGAASVPNTPGRPGAHRGGSVFQDMMRRRTSYDIDNIVIPYSMAASTRVERLQYKEIQTPKWRIVDREDPEHDQDHHPPPRQNEKVREEGEHEIEDVSEDACLARHERSEIEERRKFMSYLKQPAGVTRGRRRVDHMAADSRADQSSGANTPDQPMSPAPDALLGSKTNAEGEETGDGAETGDIAAADASLPSAATVKERRRTASLTKKEVWKFIDDTSAMSWDVDEIRTVAPYESRLFPLTDAVYEQLVAEMPPEEEEEETTPKVDTVGSSVAAVASGAAETSGVNTTVADQSRPATPTTFMSESTGSLEEAEDLDADDIEDPNDPEWEGSQGSAPRSKKR